MRLGLSRTAEGKLSQRDDQIRLLQLQSELFMTLGRWKEAEVVTRQLLGYRVDSGESPFGTEIATLDYARILENLGRFPEALGFYDDAAARIERLPYFETERAKKAIVSAFLRYGDFARLERFERQHRTGFSFDPLEPDPYRKNESQAVTIYRMAREAEKNLDHEKAKRGYAMFLTKISATQFRRDHYFHAAGFLLDHGWKEAGESGLRRYPELAAKEKPVLLGLEMWGEAMAAAGLSREGIKTLKNLEQRQEVISYIPIALARTYDLLGDSTEALRVYRLAIPRLEEMEIDDEGYFEHVGDQEDYFGEITEAYLATGQSEKALAFLRRRYGDNLSNLDAGLPEVVKKSVRAAALSSNESALLKAVARQVTRENRERMERIITKLPENRRMAAARDLSPLDYSFSVGDPELAADAVLKFKGIVLDSLARERQILNRLNLDPAQSKMLEELELLRESYLREELKSTPSQLLKPLDARITALENEVYGRSRARERIIDLDAISFAQVSAALQPGQALVEFVLFGKMSGLRNSTDHYAAIVLRNGQAPSLVHLGEAKPIDDTIKNYRKWINSVPVGTVARSNLNMGVSTASQRLYTQIFSPLEKELAGVKELFVSVDGRLHEAPLASLLDHESRFAAEKWKIRNVGSGRDLLKESSGSNGEKSALLMGNPDFAAAVAPSGDTKNSDNVQNRSVKKLLAGQGAKKRFQLALPLSPLPGTEAETNALSTMLGKSGYDVDLLSGAKAKEEALRFSKAPGILHFATHGIFREDNSAVSNPMARSFLTLAGADATLGEWNANRFPVPRGDGILLAAEAVSLNLTGTNLVVLSACSSGLGDEVRGEGVMGLKRALQQAGARNVVSTLWEISDQETVEFMELFYGEVISGHSPGDALASTQARLLRKFVQEQGIARAIYFAGPFVADVTGN